MNLRELCREVELNAVRRELTRRIRQGIRQMEGKE